MESKRWKLDRHELAGAFGDLGTLVPLVTAMIIINNINAKGVFLTFGLLYVYSGLTFGLPIPIQPMKTMAAIMITEVFSPAYLLGAGFFVGMLFVLLAFTNAISLIGKITPNAVVRGIQMGLGFNLILVALQFMLKDGFFGWILSIAGLAVVLILFDGRRFPPALLLLPMGIMFSMVSQSFPLETFTNGINVGLPEISIPTAEGIMQGALLLAIPQIPLTISNAILATSLLSRDYFGEKRQVSTKRLSISHGFMNLFSAFLGGIPVCHGAGGLAGHYRFGARTGVATIILGGFLAFLSFFYGDAVSQILSLVPFSILGVLLFFSGLELCKTFKDVNKQKAGILVALFVAFVSVTVKYGYVIGLIGGTLLFYAIKNFKHGRADSNVKHEKDALILISKQSPHFNSERRENFHVWSTHISRRQQ